MARIEFNGEAGKVWTNTTEKAQYQLIVNWSNSCGLCIQYDHAIGPWWPIPFHHGCRCRQRIIYPGQQAEPFVDFRAKIANLNHSQQARVIGASNYRLLQAGKIEWSDVVTKSRIRDFHEVVASKRLSVKEMVSAKVNRHQAEKAFAKVNTQAHVLAQAKRTEAIAQLRKLGVGPEQIKEAFGKAIAQRVVVDAGPSGGRGLLRNLVGTISKGAKDLFKQALLFALGKPRKR